MNVLKTSKKWSWLFTGSFCILFFLSCSKTNIGLGNIDSDLHVNLADTFSLELSTFLLDPLPSANQQRFLIGAFQDEDFGETVSSTSFRLSPLSLSGVEFPNDARYDSLSLRLFYDGYHYGDTTAQMEIDVFRLTESIEKRELSKALEDDEYPVFVSIETLYSDQIFSRESKSLGSLKFNPAPTSIMDTLIFRLDDNFGKTLYNMIEAQDNKLVDPDEFEEFIKGFTIAPKRGAKSIIGL